MRMPHKYLNFLANPKNTNVEWTHAAIGTETSDKNVVGTSRKESSTGVGHYLRSTNYTLKEVFHNHPSGIPRPSAGDRNGAALYYKANKNTILGIYTHPDSYMMYNQKGPVGGSKKMMRYLIFTVIVLLQFLITTFCDTAKIPLTNHEIDSIPKVEVINENFLNFLEKAIDNEKRLRLL